MTTRFLDSLSIPYLPTGTGLYVWCDLSKVCDLFSIVEDCLIDGSLCTCVCKYMQEKTFAEEDRVWKELLKSNVVVNPGVGFLCCEPGWFRIVFSSPPELLEIGKITLSCNQALKDSKFVWQPLNV